MDDSGTALLAVEAWASIIPEPRLEPLPQLTNPIWRVGGQCDQQFVLKRLPEFPPGVGPVEHGVPVALPVITDDGCILRTVADQRYALLPYLQAGNDNHELGPNGSATAHAIGSAIGHLNKVLSTCPWQVPSYVDDPVPEILGAGLLSLPSADVLPVMPIVGQLRAALADLPTARTHGDCNTGNVLVREGRVTGFIDLDHLPISPRIRDLSYYLASRLRLHLGDTDGTERNLVTMTAVLGNYVNGFHEALALSEHERAAVVPLMLVCEIGSAAWSRHGWTPNAEHYRQGVEAIAWMGTHLDELTTAAMTLPRSGT